MSTYIPKTHCGRDFKDLKPCFIDFEYNGTTEKHLNLVCASLLSGTYIANFWLHNNTNLQARLKEIILSLREDHVFVAFNVVAEASAFISLGVDPIKCAWNDLQIEYKMLTNHYHKFQYGSHLLKGKKVYTLPPKSKWEMTEEERLHRNMAKPEHNLASACFKMLGVDVDTEHKDAMRDLIISAPNEFLDDDRLAIQKYCESDVKYLPELRDAIFEAYRHSPAKQVITHPEIALRGKTAARVAIMAQTGYPVHESSVRKFSASTKEILNEVAVDFNKQFTEEKVFVWNKKTGMFSKKEAPQRKFIAESPYEKDWLRTDTGNYSLSLDAWTQHYSYRHQYPRNDFPAQILRYLKTNQSLNGFRPGGRKSFFDYYGSDGRARPWLNPYGSQSSRYQPSATGYIPLKAAWMRSMIMPKPGRAIVGIDYSSQEFLLAALLSADENMFEAFKSGDPYFYFAKLAKAVAMDSKREDHEDVRTLFKSTVLGISYLMGPKALAAKLTNDTGRYVSVDEAEGLIEKFFSVFSKYDDWIEETLYAYKVRGYLKLPDGYVMFGDNDNHRSVSNCPIQGTGAAILRKAIENIQDKKINVIIPLHDATYSEIARGDWSKIDVIYECMFDAFTHYFKGTEQYEWAKSIRMDIDVWGPGVPDRISKTPAGRKVKAQEIYVDPRARSEFEIMSKYLNLKEAVSCQRKWDYRRTTNSSTRKQVNNLSTRARNLSQRGSIAGRP